MNWEAIGATGEVVGAVAVLATLIYLAVQIRQNTIAMRSTTARETLRSFADTIAWLGNSPGNAAIFHRGLFQLDNLNPEEQTHFQLMLVNVFINADVAYTDWKSGVLGSEEWEQVVNTLNFYFSLPCGSWAWKRSGFFVTQPFRNFIESEFSLLDETGK